MDSNDIIGLLEKSALWIATSANAEDGATIYWYFPWSIDPFEIMEYHHMNGWRVKCVQPGYTRTLVGLS